jgi:hypothetical protein
LCQHALMAAYVFCLRYQDAGNWEICKRESIIGVRQSPSGINSARLLEAGDHVYVWRGGAPKPGAGLLARVVVTDEARPAQNVPWPDPSLYSCVIPFRLQEELAQPIPDSYPGNGKGTRFKIQNTDLQKGLRPLSDESELLLAACFSATDSPSVPEEVSPVDTDTGWSSDQALIRAVEAAAVQAVRKHLSDGGWKEVRDCQLDGCGYDFVFEHGDGRRRLVEVKGTSSKRLRFQLTRREHNVLSRDPSARIYVLLDALGEGRVVELDWTDVEELGVAPLSWAVGMSDNSS